MVVPPYAVKPTKQLGPNSGEEQIHKIRITLTSKNVKSIEKGTSKILSFFLSFFGIFSSNLRRPIWRKWRLNINNVDLSMV